MSTLIVLVIIIVALLAIVSYVVSVYNDLVAKRVATENAWSQIDVQLKRRHDLIPNLVETVKGYAAHESATLENVIRARNAAVKASENHNVEEQIKTEGMLSGMLRQVFALSEAYPDLKANQNFGQLSEELTTTENKISFARQHYNDCVGTYNTAIEQVPGNLIKGLGDFPKKSFFELDDAESAAVKQTPKVAFS